MVKKPLIPFAIGLVLAAGLATAQQGALDPNRFEPEIRKFEEADRTSPPPPGAVVFTGSSSIRRWTTLAQDFPNRSVLNRGFGGSEAEHVLRYADRIIVPYRPSRIVFYSGDNDLARGKTPQQIAADVRQLSELVRRQLPEARMAIMSIKPSLARWHLVTKTREANALLRELAEQSPHLTYVDVFTPMIGPDGRPIPAHFVEDGLHLTPAGYRVWQEALTPFLR
jgi:lysophospholipase L1-like esterase